MQLEQPPDLGLQPLPGARPAAAAPARTTCNTTTGTPLAPGRMQRPGCRAAPSRRGLGPPPLPAPRLFHLKGYRAFKHIMLHLKLRHLTAQPDQLGPFVLVQPAVAAHAASTILGQPVLQCARADPQVPGHLRDRLARLVRQADRALLEVLVELPARFSPIGEPFKRISPRWEGNPFEGVAPIRFVCSEWTLLGSH
jgi:hypothetical protein